ncbi:MAG: response regulator transcription factor [Verrucomicrobia bacterium]|nr:response regulator transcription factor [Verrucomicrobiota bacterium]
MPHSSSAPHAVALIDDDSPVREYLRLLLEASGRYRVVASVGSVEDGLRLPAKLTFALLFLDIGLPGLPGSAAVSQFLAARPGLAIIMLSAKRDDEAVLESLRAGACGYLLKGDPSESILRAADDAMAGGAPMSPWIAKRLLGFLRAGSGTIASEAERQEAEKLSARETEVLALAAEGLADKEIATRLNLTRSTVKNHLASVYRKWQVSSRTEAAVRFLRTNA